MTSWLLFVLLSHVINSPLSSIYFSVPQTCRLLPFLGPSTLFLLLEIFLFTTLPHALSLYNAYLFLKN